MRPDRRAKGRRPQVIQPDKCNCQKLVIALLDRADALHREEIEFLQLGHAAAYSKLHDLQAENERLRKAGDDVCEEYSFMLVQNIYPPSTKAIRAWRAATKGVQP